MAPHTWSHLGNTVSDTTHHMYYRGQRIKEAYYRGEKIWGEDFPPHVPFTFTVDVLFESTFYSTKGFNTGSGDEYLFGKLPGLWTGSHDAVVNYRFDITVPIPYTWADKPPHKIIPIVAVVYNIYNLSEGVYSHNQDYLMFTINYLIAPIKDCFNDKEFTSNGYTKYDTVDKEGKRWNSMYTHGYALRLSPSYKDVDPCVRMVSYDGVRYDHVWPGIDRPNIEAINWPRYTNLDEYDPSDPKQTTSYDYYLQMKMLQEAFLSEHQNEPQWHVNNSLSERLRNGLLDTSEIIDGGISAYRYYQPFLGSERHPDAWGIYAQGFLQNESFCKRKQSIYQDYSLHCDQNLFYGIGTGYFVNWDIANDRTIGNEKYVWDYVEKHWTLYGNPVHRHYKLAKSNVPISHMSSVNWGAKSPVRCGAEYAGWQAPEGLYISQGTMPYLTLRSEGYSYTVDKIRLGYYSYSNVSGHVSCNIKNATASAYSPNDIPCVLLSSPPASWDELYQYSPYYPRNNVAQEGENQNE